LGARVIQVKSINGQGKRSSNLDLFYPLSEHIFLILDGYGSTQEEDISDFCRQISSESYEKLEDLLNAIQDFNPSFKSCITLLEIRGEIIRYFYLGDIRIYVNSILVTEDHSYAWKLLERTKCFSREKIACKCLIHKYRNQIYKNIENIGDHKHEIVEINVDLPAEVLICTDGYWAFEHKEIIESKSYSLKELLSEDNYSAIMFSIN